jgi:hypothetical protein
MKSEIAKLPWGMLLHLLMDAYTACTTSSTTRAHILSTQWLDIYALSIIRAFIQILLLFFVLHLSGTDLLLLCTYGGGLHGHGDGI